MSEHLIGGITFDNMVIKTGSSKPPIDIQIQRRGNVSKEITGSLSLDNNGKVTSFHLKDFIAQQHEYFAAKTLRTHFRHHHR